MDTSIRKPSLEIQIIAGMIAFVPFFSLIQVFLESGYISSKPISFGLRGAFSLAIWFIVYGFLGWGILKLRRIIRLCVILCFAVHILAFPLTFIFAIITHGQTFIETLNKYGLYHVIRPLTIPMVIQSPTILYLLFIIYKLTRPKLKEQFK